MPKNKSVEKQVSLIEDNNEGSSSSSEQGTTSRYPEFRRGIKNFQELLSEVDISGFNGLEYSDPVIKLKNSFIRTLPKPDGDGFSTPRDKLAGVGFGLQEINKDT